MKISESIPARPTLGDCQRSYKLFLATVHHIPESENYEGGFEAVTMMGVPHGLMVTGSHRDSAEYALNHLLDGLRMFGFTGFVAVEDFTQPSQVA